MMMLSTSPSMLLSIPVRPHQIADRASTLRGVRGKKEGCVERNTSRRQRIGATRRQLEATPPQGWAGTKECR